MRSWLVFVGTLLLLAGVFVADTTSVHEPLVGILFVLITSAYAFYSPSIRQTGIVAGIGCLLLIADAIQDWQSTVSVEYRKLDLTKRALEVSTLCCVTYLIVNGRRARKLLSDREARLRSREQHLHTVVQSNPHCVQVLDQDLRILDINPAGLAVFGAATIASLRGRCGLDLVTPEYRAAVQAVFAAAVAGESGELDFEIHALTGEVRWLRMNVVPLRGVAPTEAPSVLAISQDISRQRVAVEALRESEARLRLAMDVAGLRMFSLDISTGRISQPPETLELLGLPPDAEMATNEQFMLIVHPDDRAAIARAIQHSLQTNAEYAATFRVTPPDGSSRWIQAAGRVEQFADGKRMVGICSDITARKNADDALRESEERFRQMAENVRDVYWMSDVRKSHIGYVNGAYERTWGRSALDLMRNPQAWLEAIHADDRDRVWHAATTKQATGDYDVEYRIIRPDGELRWIRDRAFPIHDSAGNVYRLVGIAEDITERKRIADAIAAVERRSQVLVENSFDGIAILDALGTNIFWTKSAERIFGRGPQQMLGISYLTYVHPDDIERIQHTFAELLSRPGGVTTGCWRFLREDGSWRDIEATATNMLHDPIVTGVVCNFRDVTERLQAEHESRRHLAELALMHRTTTVGQVVWELAHEIAQPLYSISNWSQACQAVLKQDGCAGLDKSLDYMRRISDQSQRATSIIASLRRFVRNEEPARYPTQLAEIVTAVVDLVGNDPRVKGLAVRTKTEDNLPLVSVDKTQIEQVLVNLLINAAEAMASGPAPERRIELRSQRTNGSVEVTVRDYGPGVSEQDLPRLFEPYYTTKSEGMGMGLAICRSIIEDHGGRMWAERNPVKGMTFHFTLPITSVPVPAGE